MSVNMDERLAAVLPVVDVAFSIFFFHISTLLEATQVKANN